MREETTMKRRTLAFVVLLLALGLMAETAHATSYPLYTTNAAHFSQSIPAILPAPNSFSPVGLCSGSPPPSGTNFLIGPNVTNVDIQTHYAEVCINNYFENIGGILYLWYGGH
jgi:hypothetical protein